MFHVEINKYNADGFRPIQINFGAFPTLDKAREWAESQVRVNHAPQRPVKAMVYQEGDWGNRKFIEAFRLDA